MKRLTFSRRGELLLGLLAILASFAVAFLGTGAVYTSTASNPSNVFTGGTVTLGTTNGNGSAYTAFSASGMQPGSIVFSDVRVVNSGTLALRYSMEATPTALSAVNGSGTANGTQLAAEMQFGVKLLNSGVTTCNDANYNAGTTVMAQNGGGFGITLNAAKAVFGNSATGQQTGDRTLAVGAAEVFCMKAVLPTSTNNATQGASATFRLDLDAEQTVNN